MTKKQTQEEFIQGCKDANNNFYGYDDFVYVNCNSIVTVTCPLHGNFTMKAYVHKAGHGCQACARINSTTKQMLTQEQAIAKVASVFPEYGLSPMMYAGSKKEVEVICPKHGSFKQKFNDLVQGHGCKKCSGEAKTLNRSSNTPDFVYKATVAKGSFYSYPRTVYVNNSTKVIITCPLHGDFEQTPSNHLGGAGCPTCGKTGFNRNKPATMYILHSGDTTKVGITGRSVTTRVKQLVGGGSPDFEIYASFYFQGGAQALNLETKTKDWLKGKYSPITSKFVGSTECFLNVDLAALINFVTPLATTETE
jgi:hypothetical protein